MVVIIDNYDSFVWNLARYVSELGRTRVVLRNDAVSVAEVAALAPSHLIISPGPCGPAEAGISNAIIRELGPSVPLLGVCLGHQCIGAVYGGQVRRAGRPMHGKTSAISHGGRGLFEGLPNPVTVGRYHSLVLAQEGLPSELEVLARSPDGEIMALRHREHPVVGVQFHPESVLTEGGHRLLANFLEGRF